MNDLEKLKKEILADGLIDSQEVEKIRELIYADGIIDSDEAEFLFALNDAVSGKGNDASWEQLFIEAISSFLLEDDNSPGEIDSDEAEWLYNKIKSDGQIDRIEKNLLTVLKRRSTSFPARLEELI